MKIVIDLQAAQSGSRHRGIGRYSLSLARSMVKNGSSEHDFVIALSGLFPETIEPIKAYFDDLLSQQNIRVWAASGPVSALEASNSWRRHAAELIREAFLDALNPDIVHIASLVEGWDDEAVHSVGLLPVKHLTAVTFYDVIPLIQRDLYLDPHPIFTDFYLERIRHLKKADIFLAISESSRQEAIKYLGALPDQVLDIAASADGNFYPLDVLPTEEACLRHRVRLTKPFLMYSGASDERKNHLRLIKAFALLPSELRERFQLALVGGMPGTHRQIFETQAHACGLTSNDVVITGRVSDREMQQLYNLCHLFVFPSWHEGFGLPALEAMACGAAVIGSNTTSMPEVIGRADALFDPFDEQSIATKMEEVLVNEGFRQDLKRHGMTQAKSFSWDKTARLALAKFEEVHKASRASGCLSAKLSRRQMKSKLIERVAALSDRPVKMDDWAKVASAIALNHPRDTRRRIYFDVSELAQRDAKTGIQRVVRSMLSALLDDPPVGYIIEPVFSVPEFIGYKHARSFLQRFLGLESTAKPDEAIEPKNGDILLIVDLQHDVVAQSTYLQSLRDWGIEVFFVVHDLIPIATSWAYPKEWNISEIHSRWLDVVQQQTGVVCVSRAVADEFRQWLCAFGTKRLRPLQIGWSHHGADISQSAPTRGFDANAPEVLRALSKRTSFLSVGTIEPRKCQAQTLAAFELLWRKDNDINLIFVGKQGWDGENWSIDSFVEKMQSHPELNRRFFWLESVSDEYLEAVYKESDCLIAASMAEGFGLPLIEAALHSVPIIARDIPVFREVAGNNAFYFSGSTDEELASCVHDWLTQPAEKKILSHALPWLTWKQSCKALLDIVLNGRYYSQWQAPGGDRYYATDGRFGTQIGERRGRGIVSVGEAGCLIYGPYVQIEAGTYNIVVRGRIFDFQHGGGRVDVVMKKSTMLLVESLLSEPGSLIDAVLASFLVSVPEKCTDLEIRVWVQKNCRIEVSVIDVLPTTFPLSPQTTKLGLVTEA